MSLTTSAELAALTSIRRRLHQVPELGFEEHETVGLLCHALDELGVHYERGIGETGIVATLQRGSGTGAIAFRADIDGLPIHETVDARQHRSTHEGRMHACGHDGHATMLLGAVRALNHSDCYDGTIHFIFQPAEEHGQGARRMISDGLFDRFPVDAVFGLHNMPWLEAGKIAMNPGPIMASEDNFSIRVRGQGGHAAMPHRTKDALTIGASIVTELQTIVARNIDPLECAVVSCTEFITDGAVNVIPTEVTIKGDTRSLTPEVSAQIEKRIHTIAAGICAAHGAELEVVYERVFLSTVNSEAETKISAQAAASVVGWSNVDAQCAPMMASEDFGAMLRERPGCYAFIGNRDASGKGSVNLHNAAYDFNDDIIPVGVGYWVALAATALPS